MHMQRFYSINIDLCAVSAVKLVFLLDKVQLGFLLDDDTRFHMCSINSRKSKIIPVFRTTCILVTCNAAKC